jgi:carotenoid cleavage dioxygenase-like enzyme
VPSRFPDIPGFREWNKPSRVECDVFDLEVEGEIPGELSGTLYRCGPDPQFPPYLGEDIFLNGDGMVSMFRLAGGHADFRMRYVRTEKFRAERAARRSLFGAYRNPYTDDPLVEGMGRGTGNTNVVWHGGRLLALKEDSWPVEVDPHTLRTAGSWAFSGKLQSRTVTAHPKMDPRTGEMVFFGYAARGEATQDVAFLVADNRGCLIREDWFVPPYASMMHDFAVTQEHVIFPVFPTTSDLGRLKAGGPHWVWDGSKPTFVGIMPRDGDVKDMRWFEGPPCFSYHIVNAFSEGQRVVVDLCQADVNPFPFIPSISGEPFDFRKGASRAIRWTFDLSRQEETFQQVTLAAGINEMPRVDDRYQTLRHRYGFLGGVDITKPPTPEAGPVGGGFTHIERLDVETGQRDSYYPPDGSSAQEPVFVPRSADSAEGDGYLLSVINRYREGRSDLVVLDAQQLSEGPVATIEVPLRLRPAFHGNWVNASDLPKAGEEEW